MVKVTVHPELRYVCFWGYSGSSNVQYFSGGGGGEGALPPPPSYVPRDGESYFRNWINYHSIAFEWVAHFRDSGVRKY